MNKVIANLPKPLLKYTTIAVCKNANFSRRPMKTPDLPCQIPDPSTYLNEPNRNNSVEKCIFAVRWKE